VTLRSPLLLALLLGAGSLHPASAQLFGQGQAPPAVDEVQGGQRVDTSRLTTRGKITILYYYSRGCAPCLRKIPYLRAMAGVRKDMRIVLLKIDRENGERSADYESPLFRQISQEPDARGNTAQGVPFVQIFDPKQRLHISGRRAATFLDQLIEAVREDAPEAFSHLDRPRS